MPQIVLYQFAPDHGVESASPFCVKVHRALRLKGLEYRKKNVNPTAVSRLNPQAKKLPVLEIDGTRVVDSTRILETIDELSPEPSLYPQDAESRGLNHVLEDWSDESLYWFAVYQRWAVDAHFEAFARGAFSRMKLPLRAIVPIVARRRALDQLHQQGIGRSTPEEVLRRLDAHLSALDDRVAEGRFMIDDRIRSADLAIFSVIRTLVLPYLTEVRERVWARRSLAAWLVRVDDVTRPDQAEEVKP